MTQPRGAMPFSYGAVDLAGLSAARPPEPADNGASATPSPPGAGGVAVIDVTEATFESEVLQRSLHTPVVIDFWAEWCGPCKQLSPVLEQLAVEGGGSWVLAKVDVDANQRLAQMFRVQSIPTVYAVVGGQPVDAFMGVIPERQLRQWIEAVLKAGGAEAAETVDPEVVDAEAKLAAGDLDGAEASYRAVLAQSPADQHAESGLARVELARRVRGADPDQLLTAAAAAPDDVAAQLIAADVEVATGAPADAFARLIGLVRRTAGDEREAVRRHLLALFAAVGSDAPEVATARRQLTRALF